MDHGQIEQKQKYAAWKAFDIRKAIKEGRKPTPGDPVDDESDLSLPSSGPSGSYVSFSTWQLMVWEYLDVGANV